MSVPRRRIRRRPVVTTEPLTAFELVTRRAVEDVEREIARIDMKVNALVVGVAVTVFTEVWRAFIR